MCLYIYINLMKCLSGINMEDLTYIHKGD